ncbi:MAG: hypothetical protein VYB54_16740 [Pseudomonadota bacterium]|nr:hypothetical protein [Pseudomonadota bacterium]
MARGRPGAAGSGSPRGPRIGIAQARLHTVISAPRDLPRGANDNQRQTLPPVVRRLALALFLAGLGLALVLLAG